jgi:NADP-dependent 3-hydroxy acid dehydrogenase YdfG
MHRRLGSDDRCQHQRRARWNRCSVTRVPPAGNGHFINVDSTAGLKIVPSQGVYAATKNAVRTITESLRQEAGDRLRVTGISPALCARTFAESMTDATTEAAMQK